MKLKAYKIKIKKNNSNDLVDDDDDGVDHRHHLAIIISITK